MLDDSEAWPTHTHTYTHTHTHTQSEEQERNEAVDASVYLPLVRYASNACQQLVIHVSS